MADAKKPTAPAAAPEPDNAETVARLAREAAKLQSLGNGHEVIVVPDGSRIEKLTSSPHSARLPTRLIAERTFHDGDSFARYVGRYKQDGSQLIADIKTNRVTAVLDYPTEAQAKFNEGGEDGDAETIPSREHKAVWIIEHSEAFKTWEEINGKYIGQDEFLAFLEENVDDIVKPDPAGVLTLVKDFSAVKTVKFERATRLQSGDANLTYVNETNVRQDLVVPRQITLRIPIYHGEEAVEFNAWFRYRIESGLRIQIEFHRIEPIKQAAFKQAVARTHDVAGLDAFYGVA